MSEENLQEKLTKNLREQSEILERQAKNRKHEKERQSVNKKRLDAKAKAQRDYDEYKRIEDDKVKRRAYQQTEEYRMTNAHQEGLQTERNIREANPLATNEQVRLAQAHTTESTKAMNKISTEENETMMEKLFRNSRSIYQDIRDMVSYDYKRRRA